MSPLNLGGVSGINFVQCARSWTVPVVDLPMAVRRMGWTGNYLSYYRYARTIMLYQSKGKIISRLLAFHTKFMQFLVQISYYVPLAFRSILH